MSHSYSREAECAASNDNVQYRHRVSQCIVTAAAHTLPTRTHHPCPLAGALVAGAGHCLWCCTCSGMVQPGAPQSSARPVSQQDVGCVCRCDCTATCGADAPQVRHTAFTGWTATHTYTHTHTNIHTISCMAGFLGYFVLRACTVTALPSRAKRARAAVSASLSRAFVRCWRMPGVATG